eukprot:4528165-Prymnesium_polylepis.1
MSHEHARKYACNDSVRSTIIDGMVDSARQRDATTCGINRSSSDSVGGACAIRLAQGVEAGALQVWWCLVTLWFPWDDRHVTVSSWRKK